MRAGGSGSGSRPGRHHRIQPGAHNDHLFDEATRVTAGDSRWQGRTSPDYWAFVGPFGGTTAATVLRALIEHPQAAGDPLALTVNYCAPIAEGPFDLDVRLVKANRSSQHWCGGAQPGRRRCRDAGHSRVRRAPPVMVAPAGADAGCAAIRDDQAPMPTSGLSWVKQYDFRFVEGGPGFDAGAQGEPHSAYSKLWIADRKPRKIDCCR